MYCCAKVVFLIVEMADCVHSGYLQFATLFVFIIFNVIVFKRRRYTRLYEILEMVLVTEEKCKKDEIN